MAPVGHLRHVVDERHPLLGEPLDDVPIVDDLVVDVDVRPEDANRLVETVDRHIDPGTKAARVGKEDVHDKVFRSENDWRKFQNRS